MANIPFPNERIDLGVNEPFIRDLQNALNVAETGVYDFLTLCHVIVHKFRHGLDHNDPTVNANTWNSIMETAHGQSPEAAANEAARGGNNPEADRPEEPADDTPRAAEERAAGGDTDRAAADDRRDETPRDGVATTGQIDRNGGNVDTAQNYRATTTGVTNATDENTPPAARPDTNPDAPRDDQPTVTAADQEREGGNAGGYTATPTDGSGNTPSPAEQAAGVQSTEQEENGGENTPTPSV
jgi:hypothetical protein